MNSVTHIEDPGEGWQVVNDWAARLCGMPLSTLRRIAEAGAEATPLTLAAEEAKRLWPGHDWIWYVQAVRRVNHEGALDAKEQRILSVYRNAIERYRLTGRC